MEAFAGVGSDYPPVVIEPLFCSHGCVNGPAVPTRHAIHERRRDVLNYAVSDKNDANSQHSIIDGVQINIAAKYSPQPT